MAHHNGSHNIQDMLNQSSLLRETRRDRPRSKPSAAFSEWYRSGADDPIYKKVLDACRTSSSRLAKCLPPDDILLLHDTGDSLGTKGFDKTAVDQFAREKCREAMSRLEQSKIKWLSDATHSFASVAVHLSELLAPMVPQSPEYTIPFGCLTIIFQILVAKQEKRERVMDIFDNLLQNLTSLDLYRLAFPTYRIKDQLAKTYISVLDLIVCVTEYCAIGRISKLVDIMSLKPKYDFDEGLQRVEESYKMLKQLVEEAIAALVVDSYETLKDQSRMIDYIANQSDYVATSIAALNEAVDTLQINQTKVQLVQTRNLSDDLINALLPDTSTEWEEFNMWQSREFRLSPKDHWEVNGMLDYLQKWNRLESASILAIFGPTWDRDTWVTEFSLDMVQAFQVQGVLVTFAMCDRPAGQVFTPPVVIKKLICQLLEQSPGLILEAPDILNSLVFRRFINFDQACLLFGSIVARLTTPLAIIVDRIDCCEADMTDSDDSQDLVGFLSELLKNHPHQVKVIITSADEPPDDGGLPVELAVSTCMIATRTRPLSKEAPRQGICGRITFEFDTFQFAGNKLFTVQRRKAVGLEQLYKFRRDIDKREYVVNWPKKFEPRSARQKTIYRYFGLQKIFISRFGCTTGLRRPLRFEAPHVLSYY